MADRTVPGQKIALVTGASGGMGKATASLLALQHGMKVILLARSADKGREAVKEVNARSGRGDAELVVCDLASLSATRAAAAEIAAKHRRLDVLVNNAGVITVKRELTEDGFERQLGVNHLGHFVLTGLLMPLLDWSEAGRIVVVSSGAHKIGRMRYEDPQMEKRYTIWGAYGRSKLANIWFAKELAVRLAAAGSPITVNALHPGAVSTQIGVDRSTGLGSSVHKLLRPFFLTPEQGSATAVHLAASAAPEVREASGQYFYKKKPAPVSRLAADADEARRFWEWSERVTAFRWDI